MGTITAMVMVKHKVIRRAKARRSTSLFQRSRGQSIAITAGAVFAAVICVQIGVAAYSYEDSPSRALSAAPGNARALIMMGEVALLGTQGKPDFMSAERFAKLALRRDSTLGTPYRVLGFAAENRGDDVGAARYIGFAGKLSRRDLASQLWLINVAVARNDVTGALEHFDTALRTSDVAPAILTPILSQALSEPKIVDELAKRLPNSPWGAQFLTEAIANSKSMMGLVRLAGQLQRQNSPLSVDNMRQLANRLIEEKAFALVGPLRGLTPARLPIGQFITDPSFDHPGEIASFDWALGQGGSADVLRSSDAGGGSKGIAFTVHSDRAGEVARQLLTLAPGHYRLAVRGRSNINSGEKPPAWSITCADTLQQLTSLDMPMAPPARIISIEYDVPGGCHAQSLVLAVRPTEHASGVEGTVDRVAIFKK